MPEHVPAAECSLRLADGRRRDLLDALGAAIEQAGAELLALEADAAENATRISLAGSPAAVRQATLACARLAVQQVDLAARQDGVAARGALDAVRLSPMVGLDLADCARLARGVAESLAEELDLAVYLLDPDADEAGRERLAAVRKHDFGTLRDALPLTPALRPDYGPDRLGRGGAVIVGAGDPFAALELRIEGAEREALEAIAAAVDGRRGGLRDARLEILDAQTGRVALRVLRPERTPPDRALRLLREEAALRGHALCDVRIRGCWPESVLRAAAARSLGLAELERAQVWELRRPAVGEIAAPPTAAAAPAAASPPASEAAAEAQAEATAEAPEAGSALATSGGLQPYLAALASPTATPGGGNALALTAAFAAALTSMVAGLTEARTEKAELRTEMARIARHADALREELAQLARRDSEAYEAVMAAYGLPRGTVEQARARREAVQEALRGATDVPLAVVRRALDVLRCLRDAAARGRASAAGDAGVAGFLALAAARGAALNVEANVMGLRDLEEGDRYRHECASLLREAEGLSAAVEGVVRERLRS